jgi:heme-degrading monooxygenase HmoA
MLKMAEMDENVTLAAQLEEDGQRSVILINKFNVKPEDVDNLLKAWAADAAYLKQKPGFISTQLHRGIGGSCVFINYAVWESVEDFKQATSDPAFRSVLAHYPDSNGRLLISLEKLLSLESLWTKFHNITLRDSRTQFIV